MKFENSKYFDALQFSKVQLSYGTFYINDQYVVSELNEGIHFDWGKVKEVIDIIYNHFGMYKKIAYISNRINSYSIEPQLWVNFHKEFNFIVASAVVSYNYYNYMNATLEKQIAKISLKRCSELSEAIDWILNLNELKSPVNQN